MLEKLSMVLFLNLITESGIMQLKKRKLLSRAKQQISLKNILKNYGLRFFSSQWQRTYIPQIEKKKYEYIIIPLTLK